MLSRSFTCKHIAIHTYSIGALLSEREAAKAIDRMFETLKRLRGPVRARLLEREHLERVFVDGMSTSWGWSSASGGNVDHHYGKENEADGAFVCQYGGKVYAVVGRGPTRASGASGVVFNVSMSNTLGAPDWHRDKEVRRSTYAQWAEKELEGQSELFRSYGRSF